METAFQSGSFAHSLDSETSLSRSSSYSVLEGSPYTIPPHVQSSHLGSDAGSSSSALQALYEGGSRGVFQWVEATAQVSQAVKMCLEQLVGPNTPGHVKRSAADVLACVCLGRHQQCSLALMSSDINGLMCQALKIASCSDAHIVRRSTQLCVLLLLCSLHQEHESREVVFGRAEHVATVLHLCLRLVASRHLTTAGEAAVCLLAPLLPLLASQAQAEAAARAVVDLLKHCVEVGCEGEGLGTWLLSEHSSSATEEGHAQGEQEVHMAPPLALRPPLFSDGIGFGCGSVASGSSTGEGSGSSISDAVAVVACKVLHALLHTDAHSSSAAGVVVEERGLAPLVALLEGRGALTTAVQAPAVTVPEAAAAAAAAASTSTQPAHSTADAILGGGTVSRVATELGVWATDCLFDVMEVCAAEGAAAQVVAAGGVKALLQLLQLPHADSPLSHKALRMLCQLLGAAEGQQSLMNQGGLPVLAGFAQTQPELVLGTLTAFCTSSAAVTRAAVAQCQPALCALVHAIGCPSAPVSQQAIAALQAVLDSAINTASDVGPEAAAGAEEAGADQAAEDGADAKQQQQGIPSEDSEEDATPEQAETAAAAAAAAVICPVALRLVEAGAMQQLDGLLGTLVDGGDAGTAEEHDHLRAAFSLCTKLVVASPDACHALLHLQQEQQQQQQQQALCGTFRASAVLLRAHTTPSDKLVASVLLLRLLQHCRASCAAPCACDLQHQQEQRQEQEQPVQHGREEEGAGAPSWVGWAAGCLASTLPTGDCSSPLAEQQQQQQQQQFTALLGTAEALEMIPLASVGIVFAEDARCLRQLTYLSTLLMPPPPSHPFFYAAAAGMPHTLLSHAFALAQHSAQSSSSSSSRRTWGCQLLQLTAPGLAAALTAEAPHPQRHTLLLRLGLQAVDCAMALCSSSSSSGGGGECEDSSTTSCSSAAPPHSAVLAVCNGLLACVNSAAVQGQMEQQQAQAVLRVCAYLQQQLLVRPEAWHVLLGIDAHAAGELTGATQQCLRAVIAALSQEQQCAHFKALAAAALTMADFATKQAQEQSASQHLQLKPKAHSQEMQGKKLQGPATRQQQEQVLLSHGTSSVHGGASWEGVEKEHTCMVVASAAGGASPSDGASAAGGAAKAGSVPSPGDRNFIVEPQAGTQQHAAGVEKAEKVTEEEEEARQEPGEGVRAASDGKDDGQEVAEEEEEEEEEEEDGRIEDLREHEGLRAQSSIGDEVQEGEIMESTAGKGDEKVEGGDKRETGRKEGRKASDGVQGKAGAERSADRGQGVAVGHDAAKAIFDLLGVEISPYIDAETAEDLVMGILSFDESEEEISFALGILKDILETLGGGVYSAHCARPSQVPAVDSATQDNKAARMEEQQAKEEAEREAQGAVAKQKAEELEATKAARIKEMQAADARAHELQQELLGVVEQWQAAAALEQELRQELQEASSPEDLSAAMLNGLSTRELKVMLQERGVECTQALEKGELVHALVHYADLQRGVMARYQRGLRQQLQQAVKAQRQAERRRMELKQQLQTVKEQGGSHSETEAQEQEAVQHQPPRHPMPHLPEAPTAAAAAAAAAQEAVQQRRMQAREARAAQQQRRQQQQQRLHQQQQQQRQQQLQQQRQQQQEQRQQPLQQMRQRQLRQQELQQQRQQQRFEFQMQQQQRRQQRQQQRQEQRQQQQQHRHCGGAGIPGWGRFMFGAVPGGTSERGGGVAEVLAEGVAEGVAEGLAEAKRFCSSFRF